MELSSLCQSVIELAKNTAEYIKTEAAISKNIEVKGKNDFVTHIDKGSEEKLVTGLSSLLPEAGFIAEEGTSTKKGDKYNWIIDPIDGTTNFIHGLCPYAISIRITSYNVCYTKLLRSFPSNFKIAWRNNKCIFRARK